MKFRPLSDPPEWYCAAVKTDDAKESVAAVSQLESLGLEPVIFSIAHCDLRVEDAVLAVYRKC